MSKIRSIAFYYPSYTLGGAELLFCRMSLALSKLYSVYLIDYKDGLLSNFAMNNGINFIQYKEDDILNVDLLVLPPNLMMDLYDNYFFSDNLKVLFWSIHPLNIESVFPLHSLVVNKSYKSRRLFYKCLLPYSYDKFRKVVKIIDECGAYIHMDYTNYSSAVNLFNLELCKKYLPIPVIGLDNSIHKVRVNTKRRFCFAWLGRVADLKVNSILHIYNDLVNLSKALNIDLHYVIVGNGPQLKDVISKCTSTDRLLVEFIGEVAAADLDNFLTENVDVLIAMGTSVLEGGKLSIPTLIVDVFFDIVPSNYRYTWLYQTIDYSLGTYVYENFISRDGVTLREVFEEADLTLEGIKCKEYTLNSHDIDLISKRLIDYSELSNLYGIHLRNLIDRNFTILFLMVRKVKLLLKKMYEKKH
ncbi:hypothetical protein [Shewanella sp. KJ2020]|uniref:hypothetical protein n=1 Tax=Shewanella sp. KJ2020 TaxID=2919172 RepID=UPI0020A7D734|nr:hypothetical protein [Shewanella sp. KJ2020]MCP3130337.1 hypothetical protein [Shewanella sp. KJ2020]